MSTIIVTVSDGEVDVDLDIDTEDLVEMFYAFKLGRDDRAMELAKKIAQDYVGGIL